jgi:hypothetical protein
LADDSLRRLPQRHSTLSTIGLNSTAAAAQVEVPAGAATALM